MTDIIRSTLAAVAMLGFAAGMLAGGGIGSVRAAEPRAGEPPSQVCPRCAPRETLELCLGAMFGERRSAAGVRGPVVFLFVNRATGSWTIIVTIDPAGARACAIAGGTGWRDDTVF